MADEKKGGELVFAGNASWSMVSKSVKTSDFDGVENQICWGFVRLRPLAGIKITKVLSGPCSASCFAISASGQVFGWGRNAQGQLGTGGVVNVYNPTQVSVLGLARSLSCLPLFFPRRGVRLA